MDDRDLVVRAREAFAAYRGLGRTIVDEMIAEIERLRRELASRGPERTAGTGTNVRIGM